MSIQGLSFKGVEGVSHTSHKINSSTNNVSTPVTTEVDEQKSNSTKLMIGATALASVVALGIAGYKGKLGKSIQQFLGGAEKEAANGKPVEQFVRPNTVKPQKPIVYSADELEKLGSKKMYELSSEESKKLWNTVIPLDEPVMRNFIKTVLDCSGSSKISVKETIETAQLLHRAARIKYGNEGMKKLFGIKSPLCKKINEITVNDALSLPEKTLQKLFNQKELAEIKSLAAANKDTKMINTSCFSDIVKEADPNKSIMDYFEKMLVKEALG